MVKIVPSSDHVQDPVMPLVAASALIGMQTIVHSTIAMHKIPEANLFIFCLLCKKCAAEAAHEKRTAPFAATQTSTLPTGMRNGHAFLPR